MKIGYLI